MVKGVKTLSITEKTGDLISINNVNDNDDLMIINKSNIVIRIAVNQLRVMGRATQGVRLITLKKNDSISSVAKVEHEEEEIDDETMLTAEALGENLGENLNEGPETDDTNIEGDSEKED